MASINRLMFREYDVRGQVKEGELTKESVYLIGRGFGTFLAKKEIREVVIGYDARSYSEWIKDETARGLADSGLRVIEIGLVTTPILYWSQYHLGQKGSAMVTASHNPNGWSGFKLSYGYSKTMGPEEIKELYSLIEKDTFVSEKGSIEKYAGDIIAEYGADLLSRVKINKKMKIVVDCGNGTAGPIYPNILKQAGLRVEELFCDLDFTFPNHEPNPSDAHAAQFVCDKTREVGADLGIGFDGDGDRLGISDELGARVDADKFLCLLSRQALLESPGGKIVFDVKCSQSLPDDIVAHGGVPVMWKTGHSYIKQKSQEIGAILGGEKSGHIFYAKSFFPHDDALFAALKLLEYLSNQTESFSRIMKTVPQYVTTPTLQAPCADEIKYKIVEKLVAEFKAEYGSEKVIDINGARVLFPEGWGLVRASSNLPVIVMVFEGKTEEDVEKIKEIFKAKFAKYPEIGMEWKFG
ncbi:MAG: Phosphomannomutase [Parcubacteria group bacterium Gr01-1014_18]|nr:MAG: Phosphomannomutase [Parcubacteria group bacterium Greene0416_36]TSC79872.1 MAG: Phosphomannomutase [Parcubacteria group bacterium Gr01-1014_18]TSC98304.1 MAG: Phosphomannomutase [Parcubacteria group bacterium Greene1014_20]TSD06655.1 MAG: Phosphomannomutase [Parcubacteria group bacterium Greene0714_2]